MNYITVTPAYGRDYKSRAAMLVDWEAGKDFIEGRSGKYCSKRDFENIHAVVSGRYRRLTMVAELARYGDQRTNPRR